MSRASENIHLLAVECESQLSSGVIESVEQFLSQYPELREELASELKKHQTVSLAIDLAAATDDVSTVAPQETVAYDSKSAVAAHQQVACPECRTVIRLASAAHYSDEVAQRVQAAQVQN